MGAWRQWSMIMKVTIPSITSDAIVLVSGNNINSYLNRILGRFDDVSAQYKHFVNEQMFLRGDQDCVHPVTGQTVQAERSNLKTWESPICGGDGRSSVWASICSLA